MEENRPTLSDLRQWLNDPLTASLGDRFGKLDISLLSQAKSIADGTTVLLLRDAAGQSRAVVLCSAPASPGLVQRAMARAHQAKVILGPSIGAHVLDPLVEGSARGLTYAVLPYCYKLSDSRPVWWIQRALLRRPVLEWLRRLTECTVQGVKEFEIGPRFAEPLRQIVSLDSVSKRVRCAAERAIERLRSGTWTPQYVLMHGDFEKGNLLIHPANKEYEKRGWRERFVVIDWPGSVIQGYAIFDLVRLSQSMRLNAQSLRNEVDRHCHLLRCERADAASYLLAALGHIAMNLEHFPMDRYARMADACLATLERILD